MLFRVAKNIGWIGGSRSAVNDPEPAAGRINKKTRDSPSWTRKARRLRLTERTRIAAGPRAHGTRNVVPRLAEVDGEDSLGSEKR